MGKEYGWEMLVDTPVGRIRVLGSSGFLTRIVLPCFEFHSAEKKPPPGEELKFRLKEAIDKWFHGEEEDLRSIPNTRKGTGFQKKVWREVERIRRGTVKTYKDVSIMVTGSPNSARAVGNALRANPLPLLIPCHRVIGAGRNLRGFGGKGRAGIGVKKRLLMLEGIKW